MYYFIIFSSGIVNSILSHICGRLYFPMFLFRVGLLTLINMASCMVLAKLFSSLPMILKLFIDVIWPLVFWCVDIAEGFFKCSLNLSPKVLEVGWGGGGTMTRLHNIVIAIVDIITIAIKQTDNLTNNEHDNHISSMDTKTILKLQCLQ